MLSVLTPDHVFTGLKAQTRRKCLHEIAVRIAAVTRLDAVIMARLFNKKEIKRSSAIGGGVAVIDLQSIRLQKPFFCLAVLDHGADFRAPDGEKVDLIACVLSPHADGPVHLQRISSISRLLRDQTLCQAVREAKDPDAIRLLLMSPESRLYAA
ncbi:MAG: PTS sugar transporter subunit IIA [Alphaproteobacteria bacterium]|nr:PTS sugar transporter subunit IIA [Alphaproteobacteria bacterium]